MDIRNKIAAGFYQYPAPEVPDSIVNRKDPNYKVFVRECYKEQAMKALFLQDVLKSLGLQDHPKGDKLISLAWEYGHSAGLEEVLSYAEELSELLS
jgi:hypothetical protein